jgi:serine/threonine protein kinase
VTLYDSAGRPLPTAERLGGGGEGEVYRLRDQRERAVKVFHAKRMTPELARKLRVMRDRRPDDPNWSTRRHRSFAWVEELAFADPGARAVAGYVMPAVDLDLFRQAHCSYDTADRIRRFGGEFTWRHLLAAAFNLATAVAALHAEGHRIGDVRETNVLVAPNALVTLVDCDSFEVHGAGGEVYPTRVGTLEYLPPELHGIDLASAGDRLHADRFGLAVLLFQLLMLGAHPFQARGGAVDAAPSTDAKIRLGLFAYEGGRRDLRPPDFAPPWKVVPPRLRALFVRAFVDGHGRPERRPSAEAWVRELDAAGRSLRTCGSNPHHRFAPHLRRCPWCAVRPDPFPALPRLGAQAPQTPAGAGPTPAERRFWLRSHVELAEADGELTRAEHAYLGKLGAHIGLRSQDVAAVLAEPRPKPSAAGSEPRRRVRFGTAASLAPLTLLAAAAGYAEPLIAPAAITAGALPALALAAERPRWAAAAPRLLQLVFHTLEVLVPLLLPVAAIMLASTLALHVAVAQHVAGAVSAAAIVAWAGLSDDEHFAAVRRAVAALVSFATTTAAHRVAVGR